MRGTGLDVQEDTDDLRALFQSTDWGETPLGTRDAWPAPLKTAIGIALGSCSPMAVYWGAEQIVLYNAAWARLIGAKHPAALGRAARDVFPEAWDELSPLLDVVMTGRGSVRIEDRLLPMDRSGMVEDAWFSFSMDAIPLESGDPGGVLNIAVETTEQVLSRRDAALRADAAREIEERKAFALSLADALRPLADPAAIQAEAARLLGRHLEANRVHYGEVRAEADGTFMTEIRQGYGHGLAPMIGTFRQQDGGWAHRLLSSHRAGRTVVCQDVDADPTIGADEAAVIRQGGYRAYVAVPLVKAGLWVAVLAVHSVHPRHWTEAEVALVEETAERTWAAVEQARAETALRESEARYRALFESIDEGFYRARAIFDAAGRCVDVAYDDENPSAVRMVGKPARGRLLSEIGPFEPYWLEIFGQAARSGVPQRMERYAAVDDKWYNFYVFKPQGAGPDDLAVIFRDVTERKRSEDRQTTLAAELDHRVKNILSVVQSIARQSLGRSDDAKRLMGRISALAQSHAILATNRWEGARFGELVQNAVAPYQSEDGARIVMGGPDLKVMPKAAQTLTLALHELVTNAAKYGALSRETGQVVAKWILAEDGDERRLRFTWTEHGGPPVSGPPERSGFGSRLIERTLAYELGGVVSLDFAPDGLRAVLDLPMNRLRARRAWQQRSRVLDGAARGAVPPSLTGKRILVAEDEEFVADETAVALRGAGCEVVGPMPTLEMALKAAVSEPLDAAVLDINLGGELIWPVALALEARGIPIVFATGYARTFPAPARFADAPWIEKPLLPQRLVAAVASLVGAGGDGAG